MRISANLAMALARVGPTSPTQAHSLKELKDALSTRKKYFQPVDQPAPTFPLQNVGSQAATNVIDKKGQLRGRFRGLRFAPLSLFTFANALVNDVDRRHPEPQPEWSLWSWFTSLLSGSGQPSGGGVQ